MAFTAQEFFGTRVGDFSSMSDEDYKSMCPELVKAFALMRLIGTDIKVFNLSNLLECKEDAIQGDFLPTASTLTYIPSCGGFTTYFDNNYLVYGHNDKLLKISIDAVRKTGYPFKRNEISKYTYSSPMLLLSEGRLKVLHTAIVDGWSVNRKILKAIQNINKLLRRTERVEKQQKIIEQAIGLGIIAIVIDVYDPFQYVPKIVSVSTSKYITIPLSGMTGVGNIHIGAVNMSNYMFEYLDLLGASKLNFKDKDFVNYVPLRDMDLTSSTETNWEMNDTWRKYASRCYQDLDSIRTCPEVVLHTTARYGSSMLKHEIYRGTEPYKLVSSEKLVCDFRGKPDKP